MMVVAFAALFAPVAARGQTSSTAPDSAVSAFLESTVALAQRRDTAALRQLAAERFVFVHSSGRVQSLDEFLAFVVRGRQDSIRVLSPPEVRDAGSAAYVLTHTASWVPGRGWTAFRATDVVVRTPAGLRWLGHQSTALPTSPEFAPIAPGIAEAITGRYVSAAGVVREVTVAGDRLLVRTGGAPPVRYGALTETTFHAEGGDAFIVFQREGRGHAHALEVLQDARVEHFERRDAP